VAPTPARAGLGIFLSGRRPICGVVRARTPPAAWSLGFLAPACPAAAIYRQLEDRKAWPIGMTTLCPADFKPAPVLAQLRPGLPVVGVGAGKLSRPPKPPQRPGRCFFAALRLPQKAALHPGFERWDRHLAEAAGLARPDGLPAQCGWPWPLAGFRAPPRRRGLARSLGRCCWRWEQIPIKKGFDRGWWAPLRVEIAADTQLAPL